jgi:hypothetical protein
MAWNVALPDRPARLIGLDKDGCERPVDRLVVCGESLEVISEFAITPDVFRSGEG